MGDLYAKLTVRKWREKKRVALFAKKTLSRGRLLLVDGMDRAGLRGGSVLTDSGKKRAAKRLVVVPVGGGWCRGGGNGGGL